MSVQERENENARSQGANKPSRLWKGVSSALEPAVSLAMMRFVALALTLAALSASPAAQAACPQREDYPLDGWPDATADTLALRASAVEALGQYAFTREGADEARTGIRTDSVVVVHKGRIVYERYADDWSRDRKHLTWSVSKSITSALVGIATERANVDVRKSICTWVESPIPEHCEITLEHMLWMSSGLHWQEVYEGKSNRASSVLSMLYGAGNADIPAFVLGHRRAHPPGRFRSYSSGETNVIMAIVDKAMRETGESAGWPYKFLFDRIGMKRVTLERDQAGHAVGSSYVYTRPRDLLRFGFLYLNDGCWGQEQVLPEGWVGASLERAPAPAQEDPTDVYGYQWWLNLPNEASEGGRPWPALPADAYSARGHWGQTLTVVPSLDLVFVRMADDRDGTFDYNRFSALVLDLIE